MRDALHLLTDREKQTLRLILGGHDAKSTARRLGLSVHTVNERLRDARRKLGVSSSREAARLLAEAERGVPDSVGDKELGVVAAADDVPHGSRAAHRLAWFGGGMLMMSLVIAAAALSFGFSGDGAPVARPAGTPGEAVATPKPAGLGSARAWVALLDRERWEESWRTASASFKAAVPAAQWGSVIEAVRRPLGPVSARSVLNATRTSSLPGMPTGDYEVIQFRTDFARKSGAVEIVTVAREGGGWKVAGYYIR